MVSLLQLRTYFQPNRKLFALKMTFFMVFAARTSIWAYVNIISSKIVTFQQLAIIFAFVPVASIVGPILAGLIVDKTGNYKFTMTAILLMGSAAHSLILWLESVSLQDHSGENLNVGLPFSIYGHGTEIHISSLSDLPSVNETFSLDPTLFNCWNVSRECLENLESLDISIRKDTFDQSEWTVETRTGFLDVCGRLNCTFDYKYSSGSGYGGGEMRRVIFPVLFIIRVLGFVSVDAVTPLLDAVGLYMTKLHGGDFSQQKMWSMMSIIIIPLICGSLVDLMERLKGYKDYSIPFVVCAIVSALSSVLFFKLDFNAERNKDSMLDTIKTVARMPDVNVFFVVQMVLGLCWGFHFNFVPIYLDTELGTSKTFLGMTLSFNGIGSVIALGLGPIILRRFVPAHIMAMSLLLYCTRFVCYCYLSNSWFVLTVELADGFCGTFAYVAGSYFCASAAKPGMLASFNGILSAAFYGAGRGVGTSLGSVLIAKFGIRVTYLIFGLTAGLTSLLYLAAYHLWLKRLEEKRLASNYDGGQHKKGVDNSAADVKDEIL